MAFQIIHIAIWCPLPAATFFPTKSCIKADFGIDPFFLSVDYTRQIQKNYSVTLSH